MEIKKLLDNKSMKAKHYKAIADWLGSQKLVRQSLAGDHSKSNMLVMVYESTFWTITAQRRENEDLAKYVRILSVKVKG